ncbi:MAG: carboxypeptidase regulatory-like domain-containing protein [Saprospiraceae bacterium]
MKKFYAIPWIVCFLFFQNITIHSQTTIVGKVTDKETSEELIAANIVIKKSGVVVQGETTDINGNYTIRVDPGTYDMEISYTGYATQLVTDVVVNIDQTSKVDVKLESGGMIICGIGCLWGYKIPLIKQDETSTGITISSEQIKNLPTRNINEMPLITPGVSIRQ